MHIFPKYLLTASEVAEVFLLCVIAFWKPTFGWDFFHRVSQYWRRLASRRVAAVLTVGVVAVLIRAALLPIEPVPDPTIHDEFGHLLIADTIASGRLTNPPHPYWTHFESIYLLQQPTYTSQYPPAIGIVLGAAQAITGCPWVGVLFSMGIFCALMCWCLQGWLPPSAALLGGVLAIIQFGVINYWINSYWGGFVPGIGGLLVLGGIARLRNGALFRNSLWITLGLAILMNSRPAEALIFGCVICTLLAFWMFRTSELKLKPAFTRVIVPMAIGLSLVLSGMFYYNYRVTGKPLELPYMLNQKVYGSPQAYWWQRPVLVKSFRHKEMRDDYLRQLHLYERRSSPTLLLRAIVGRIRDFWAFYIDIIFTLPLLFFWPTLRDRGTLLMLAICAPFLLDYLTFHAFYAHYASPVAGATMFLLVQCWRHLRVWSWRGKPSGLFLARTLPLAAAFSVLCVLCAGVLAARPSAMQSTFRTIESDYFPDRTFRGNLERKLDTSGGYYLIFVHYTQPGHNPDDEWVYNRANIDKSHVVWARQIDQTSDDQLRKYYSHRQAFILNADAHPPQLIPYSAPCQSCLRTTSLPRFEPSR